MKAKNSLTNLGSITAGGNVHVGDQTIVRLVKGGKRPAYYPAGCIGADLPKRNYVKYLVERYHEFREADARLGRTERLHYAVIFKNIESRSIFTSALRIHERVQVHPEPLRWLCIRLRILLCAVLCRTAADRLTWGDWVVVKRNAVDLAAEACHSGVFKTAMPSTCPVSRIRTSRSRGS